MHADPMDPILSVAAASNIASQQATTPQGGKGSGGAPGLKHMPNQYRFIEKLPSIDMLDKFSSSERKLTKYASNQQQQ